jgi:hypothetical protein
VKLRAAFVLAAVLLLLGVATVWGFGSLMAQPHVAPGPKRLWLIEGTGHAATWSIFNAEYRHRVQALFETSLGPA